MHTEVQNTVVIVLGCSILKEKDPKIGVRYVPGKLLTLRLKRALELRRDLNEKGCDAQLLLSGGGRRSSKEADVMSKYLEERNVAKEKIWIENKSMSTIENIIMAMALLKDKFPALGLRVPLVSGSVSSPEQRPKLYIVTSSFHIGRTRLLFDYFHLFRLFDISFISAGVPRNLILGREKKELAALNVLSSDPQYRGSILAIFGMPVIHNPFSEMVDFLQKKHLTIATLMGSIDAKEAALHRRAAPQKKSNLKRPRGTASFRLPVKKRARFSLTVSRRLRATDH